MKVLDKKKGEIVNEYYGIYFILPTVFGDNILTIYINIMSIYHIPRNYFTPLGQNLRECNNYKRLKFYKFNKKREGAKIIRDCNLKKLIKKRVVQ